MGETAVHPSEELDMDVVVDELRQFLQPPTADVSQLAQAVAEAVAEQRGSGVRQDAEIDVARLADSLTRAAYSVRVRRAVGGGEGSLCLHNLRHTFLLCNSSTPDFGSRAAQPPPICVDPSFAEQFLIAKPTERYAALLACLPEVLVMPEDRISALVTFLSAELTLAFKASGSVLPPWRQTSSMLTKWQPRRSTDLQVNIAFGPAPALAGTSVDKKRHLQQQGGRDVSGGGGDCSQDGKAAAAGAWGIKIAATAASAGRPVAAVKAQAMEPTRVYGGFGGINMVVSG